MQIKNRNTQRIPWLFGYTVDKIAYRGLAATDLFSDLWLSHLTVTLDFGNNVFPFHTHIVQREYVIYKWTREIYFD